LWRSDYQKMLSLNERALLAVMAVTPERGRPRFLEERTRLPAQSWKKFLEGRQRASLDMVEAVCREWPEYAFWISTGLTDVEHGHISVPGALPAMEPVEEAIEQSRRYFRIQRHVLGLVMMNRNPAPVDPGGDALDARARAMTEWSAFNEACHRALESDGLYKQVGLQREMRMMEIASLREHFAALFEMTPEERAQRNAWRLEEQARDGRLV
jgi:hypothetical protein